MLVVMKDPPPIGGRAEKDKAGTGMQTLILPHTAAVRRPGPGAAPGSIPSSGLRREGRTEGLRDAAVVSTSGRGLVC